MLSQLTQIKSDPLDVLLFAVGLRLTQLAKTGDDKFKALLENRNFTIQLGSEAEETSRYYEVSNGIFSQHAGPAKEPTLTITFKDSMTGVKLLTKGEATAFMTGIQNGELKMSGDYSLLMWFNQVAKYIVPKVPEPLKPVVEQAKPLIDKVTPFAKDLCNKAMAMLGGASATKASGTSKYFNESNTKDVSAGKDSEDTNTLDTIKAKAVEIKDEVVEKFDELKTEAKEKLDTLKEDASEKLADIKDTASEKVSDAKDKLDEVKEQATDKLNEVKDQASDKLGEVKEQATDKLDEVKEQATDKLSEVKEQVADKVAETKDAAAETLDDAKTAKDDKVDEVKTKLEDVKDQAAEKVADVKQLASEKLDDAKAKVEDLKTQADEKLDALNEEAKEKYSDAKDKVEEVKQSVKDAAVKSDTDENVSDNKAIEQKYAVVKDTVVKDTTDTSSTDKDDSPSATDEIRPDNVFAKSADNEQLTPAMRKTAEIEAKHADEEVIADNVKTSAVTDEKSPITNISVTRVDNSHNK